MVSTTTKVLTVRIPNEMAEQIKRIAAQMNKPQSQVMVMMLAEWLTSYGYTTTEDDK